VAKQLVLILDKDKVTKNKVVRYADGANHNIYVQPEEVEELGLGDKLKVTLESIN